MQCRWAGCVESRQKGDSKYCQKHRKVSTAQALELMTIMFRSRTPLSLVVVVHEREKKVKASKSKSNATKISNEMRDQLEKEQNQINAELDKKYGYGNGPINTLTPDQIETLTPNITPIDQIRDAGRGRRKGVRAIRFSNSVGEKLQEKGERG
jgi:hypothetical protein